MRRAEETAQTIASMRTRVGSLSIVQNPDMVLLPVIPALGLKEQKSPWALANQSSQSAEIKSPDKESRWKAIEEDISFSPLVSVYTAHTNMTYKHERTSTHTHKRL